MRAAIPFLVSLTALSLSACTQPRTTTGIGSAAGGALGAGLGAIIGSQSGSAGSGLAIGAVAGAAGGALIGNAFQAQEEATRSQDEALERQARVMAVQRREISELRQVKSDSYLGRIDTNRRYPPLASQKSPRLPSLAKQPSLTKHPTLKTQPNGKLQAPESPSAGKVIERDLSVESSPRARWQEPTAKKLIAVNPDVAENTSVSKTEQKFEESVPETKLSDKQETSPPGCADAEEERELAKKSPGSSEKLFHLRRALRFCPDKAELHHELGLAYLSMKRTPDAEFEFSQALKLNPQYTPAKKSLSKITQQEKF